MKRKETKEREQRAAQEEFSHEFMKFSIIKSDDKYKTSTTSHYMQERKT